MIVVYYDNMETGNGWSDKGSILNGFSSYKFLVTLYQSLVAALIISFGALQASKYLF